MGNSLSYKNDTESISESLNVKSDPVIDYLIEKGNFKNDFKEEIEYVSNSLEVEKDLNKKLIQLVDILIKKWIYPNQII